MHATPYDITAAGFYFDSFEAFERKAATHRNEYGQHVEEYEIQPIELPNAIDSVLAKAIAPDQRNLQDWIDALDWTDDAKIKAIIAIEAGYDIDLTGDPDDLDIIVYRGMSLVDIAEQMVDDGVYGDIPEAAMPYIDCGAIARDMEYSGQYGTTDIAGEHIVYEVCQ